MSFIVHVDTCLMIQAASIALLRNLLVNTDGRTRTRKVGSSWSCIQFFFFGEEKFLVVADISSHMFGALWMSPSSDVNHRNLSYWLKEFGCMDGNPQGLLHVYTDDEVAVGAVFQDAKLDKPVKVTRAAPQSPETNALAECCVRTLKETLVVLRMDLQTSGLDIQRTGAALHELVLYISHMSNMYVGVHGTTI